jgi:beta-1,4-N-acetylglucosaminyltransferase
VFVTVGTTKFDALIKAMDRHEVANALTKKGYSKLIMQMGAAQYTPSVLFPDDKASGTLPNGLHVSYFQFAPSLADYMQQADLIISHAGSGSIFEALRLRKALIAVPNSILMHNHQAELAEHLQSLHYLFAATPDTLVDAIQRMDVSSLREYPKGDASGIVTAIDKLMGFA